MARLFVSIPIPFINSDILQTIKKLKLSFDKKEINVQWVPNENLHLTLFFIGEINDPEPIKFKLREIAPFLSPFELHLKGIGAFPDMITSRVLWIGARQTKGLLETYDAIKIKMNIKENIQFSPHITIARLRNNRCTRDILSPFLRKDFGKTVVNEIILYESKLFGHYLKYIQLEKFPLEPSFSAAP